MATFPRQEKVGTTLQDIESFWISRDIYHFSQNQWLTDRVLSFFFLVLILFHYIFPEIT